MEHTDNKSLVEKVARAICYENYCPCCVTPEIIENNWEEYIPHAEAAIAVVQNQQGSVNQQMLEALKEIQERCDDTVAEALGGGIFPDTLYNSLLLALSNKAKQAIAAAESSKPDPRDEIIAKLVKALENVRDNCGASQMVKGWHIHIAQQTLAEVKQMEEGI